MDEKLRIIIIGYDDSRCQFRIEVPCEINIKKYSESEILSKSAKQLLDEHKVKAKKMRIVCCRGKSNYKPAWKHNWHVITFPEK